MQNALTTAIQAMQSDMQRLDTISQNMANAATPGYKREIRTIRAFADVLRTEESAREAAAPLGIDVSAGPLRATGQPFDLGLNGDGYFEVATPQGPGYTRAGRFHLDAGGRLVTEAGLPVQGVAGDIVLKGANAQIDQFGRITQQDQMVAQVKVVQFEPGQSMQRLGNGLLRPVGAASATPASNPRIQPGYLEGSNVTPLHEMIALTETVRHFEAAQKLFQGYEDQLNSAIKSLAQV